MGKEGGYGLVPGSVPPTDLAVLPPAFPFQVRRCSCFGVSGCCSFPLNTSPSSQNICAMEEGNGSARMSQKVALNHILRGCGSVEAEYKHWAVDGDKYVTIVRPQSNATAIVCGREFKLCFSTAYDSAEQAEDAAAGEAIRYLSNGCSHNGVMCCDMRRLRALLEELSL